MTRIIVSPMAVRLTGALREAPTTLLALVALAVCVVLAGSEAGFPVTHWAPAGLVVLALLVIAALRVPTRLAALPLAVRVALGALFAYTALSYLSILWADVPGDAWEGANRTLLYLLVFALFACWPGRGKAAAGLICAWTLAMLVLAIVTAVHLDSASAAKLQTLLPGGRLDSPSGYPNANAAQWLIAFWPAFLLARSERLWWWLRGLFAGGAVFLAEIALLSQSRGSLYATPVMVVIVLVAFPRRLRTFALLVPVAAGIAAAAPAVLRAGDLTGSGLVKQDAVHSALAASALAALLVGLAVAVGAVVESRLDLSALTRRRVRLAVAGAAAVALLAGVVGGLAVAGNPITRVEHGWNSFKGGYAGSATGSRLGSGLGSNRYDFYRVALDQFDDHPLLGIGADNFQEQYLKLGHSSETPRYPHSVELRTLSQTGLLGMLLGVIGLGAALFAGWRAMRGEDPLAAAVAAATLAGFLYWLVHGSFDWFWEFAGLGLPAFALLGMTCALSGRSGDGEVPVRAAAPRIVWRALPAAALALVCAATLLAPWLSQLELQSAARIWTKAPDAAYSRLHEAADLNPLSAAPNLLVGSIALRYGELARADRAFARALARDPGNVYATLERGAIASTRGQQAAATALLARAVSLAPREGLARAALRLVREGKRVSVEELNREILQKADQFA
ncbi:MAG TPA: O-antigen ligase family protein [Solirubrobacteraceae bacterium]